MVFLVVFDAGNLVWQPLSVVDLQPGPHIRLFWPASISWLSAWVERRWFYSKYDFSFRIFISGFFLREGEWIEKTTGWNQTFISALLAQFQHVGLPFNWTVTKASSHIKSYYLMRLLEILAQSSVPAKQCNYNASSNPKLSILCKLSRRSYTIL